MARRRNVTAGLWESHREKLVALDGRYGTHFPEWATQLSAMDRGESVRIRGWEIPGCPLSEQCETFELLPDGSVTYIETRPR